MERFQNDYRTGLRHGIPIGLGYLSVSFTFGMMAVAQGLPVLGSLLISMTNLTSAGQFAGLLVMVGGGGLWELATAQLVINLRYALMSLSLSQKLHPSVRFIDRLWMAFANTDEIFAVASGQPGLVGKIYFLGLMTLPYIGWSLGTFLGATAGTLLPTFVTSVMGLALYGMFLAIIVPPAKRDRRVLIVVLIAVGLSCLMTWAPVLNSLSEAITIIICAVAASAAGAIFFPIEDNNTAEDAENTEEAAK